MHKHPPVMFDLLNICVGVNVTQQIRNNAGVSLELFPA